MFRTRALAIGLFALTASVALLVSSLASAPAAQAHGPVDQSSPGFPASSGAGIFDDAHPGNRFQEFTPSISPLTGVDLVVGRFNPTLCPADFTVKIRSGSTDGPILGETTLSDVTPEFFDPPSILHFDFSSVIPVVTGNVHYIESRTTTVCGGLHILNFGNPNTLTVVFQTFGASAPVGGIALDSGLQPLLATQPDERDAFVKADPRSAALAIAALTALGAAALYRRRRQA